MKQARTIVYPTDLSAGTEQALRQACALARQEAARLIILVQPPPVVLVHGGKVMIVGDHTKVPPPEERLRRIVEENADVSIETRSLQERTEAELLQAIRETECDLIVMPTEGRSGLEERAMSRVIDRVRRSAGCVVVPVGRLPLPARL